MPYVIETYDKPDAAEIRAAFRAQHYDYLRSVKFKLIASGGLKDNAGAVLGNLIIMHAASRHEVDAFIANDPFTKADLFARITVKNWFGEFLEGREII